MQHCQGAVCVIHECIRLYFSISEPCSAVYWPVNKTFTWLFDIEHLFVYLLFKAKVYLYYIFSIIPYCTMVVLFGVLEMLDLLLGHDFFLLHYVLQQSDGVSQNEVHVDSLFYAFGWGFLDSYLLVLILELSMTLRKKITLGQVWNINSFISYY